METFAKIYLSTERTPRLIRSILIRSANRITFVNDPTQDQVAEFLAYLSETDELWLFDQMLTLRQDELEHYPLKQIKFVLSEHGEVMWEDPSSRASTRIESTDVI